MERDVQIEYTEIYEILNLLNESYKKKIPIKLYKYIEENKLKNYDKEKIIEKINNNNISQGAIDLFALIYLKYFSEDELEKKILLQIYNSNNNKSKNINNITTKINMFEEKEKDKEKDKKVEMSIEKTNIVKYNNNIFIKTINKIKNFIFSIFRK